MAIVQSQPQEAFFFFQHVLILENLKPELHKSNSILFLYSSFCAHFFLPISMRSLRQAASYSFMGSILCESLDALGVYQARSRHAEVSLFRALKWRADVSKFNKLGLKASDCPWGHTAPVTMGEFQALRIFCDAELRSQIMLGSSQTRGSWVSELISLCHGLVQLLYKVLKEVASIPPYAIIVC